MSERDAARGVNIGDALVTCYAYDKRTYFLARPGGVWRARRGRRAVPVVTADGAPLVATTLGLIGRATVVATDEAGEAWIIGEDNIARRRERIG